MATCQDEKGTKMTGLYATEEEALFALESDEIEEFPQPPNMEPDLPQEVEL